MILVTDGASRSDPALKRFLTGAGLPLTDDPAAATRRILPYSDASAARAEDVVVDFADGPPSLRIAPQGPAHIRFGFEDMAFGHALVAEVVRPAQRPACGEPESAR